ncbi:MAG: DUF3618 domain-containing protein [Sphingomonas bacterium]
MSDISELDIAEARAIEARQRMTETLDMLQSRLAPATLAHEAKARLSDAGGQALDAARRNPGKVAGGVALLAAFLGRRHIGRMIATARKARAERKGK